MGRSRDSTRKNFKTPTATCPGSSGTAKKLLGAVVNGSNAATMGDYYQYYAGQIPVPENRWPAGRSSTPSRPLVIAGFIPSIETIESDRANDNRVIYSCSDELDGDQMEDMVTPATAR